MGVIRRIGTSFIMASAVLLLTGCLTGTIEGDVVDRHDRALKGAVVTTEPPSHSVRSGENGYVLENVPIGTYTIEANKPGYESDEVEIKVRWNSRTIADIQILEQDEE